MLMLYSTISNKLTAGGTLVTKNSKEEMSDFSIKTMADGDNLNLLGYVPVPIKRALKENLEKLI